MKLTILSILLLIQFRGLAQQVYYISSLGSDSNNGTSSSTPWKTIREVDPGSTYLLKKGETHYFSIFEAKKTVANKKTLISTYGDGENPVISLFKKIKSESWNEYSTDIWRVDLTNSNNYSGIISSDTNVGFLKVDGKIYGNKNSELAMLINEWDFYSDKTFLYVYSKSKPSSIAASIEISWNITGIRLSNGMTVEDIKIIGAGAHGVSGRLCENVTLRNLNVTEIGGCYLANFKNGTTRYGNGIQIGDGSNNCLIENCTVSEVYDAAYTMQGDYSLTHFINTTFKNNIAVNNEQSFEVWIKGGGGGFTNCRFVNNNCSRAGFGWSHAYRPAKYEAVHLLSYDLDCVNSDLIVEDNIFNMARSGLYFYLNDPNIPKYTLRNNVITLHANVPIRALSYITKNRRISAIDFETFVKSTGYEKGSKFNVIQGVMP